MLLVSVFYRLHTFSIDLPKFNIMKCLIYWSTHTHTYTAAPLHWIYDQDKVKTLADETTAFYPTSQCPFYTIPTGRNSAYGSQVLATLRNVAENKGQPKKFLYRNIRFCVCVYHFSSSSTLCNGNLSSQLNLISHVDLQVSMLASLLMIHSRSLDQVQCMKMLVHSQGHQSKGRGLTTA